MINWNNKWIKSAESPWSIFEKFKYVNTINSKELYDYLSNNKKNKLNKRKGSNIKLDNLPEDLNYQFYLTTNINVNQKPEQFLSMLNIPKEVTPYFRNDLFYCRKCISNGYHSLYHQILFTDKCPYHEGQSLTSICPKCKNHFREYSFGFSENPYSCQHCNHSVLKQKSFKKMINAWIKEVTPTKDSLKSLEVFKFNGIKIFIYPQVLQSDRIFNSTKFHPKALEQINKLFLSENDYPNCNDLQSTFNLKYPKSNKIRKNYFYRELTINYFDKKLDLPINRRVSNDYLELMLNLELFKQSKAILKTVERYILKSLNNNTKRKIKKSYNEFGYNSKSKFKHPFIDWKNEVYMPWSFNYLNHALYPRFKHTHYTYYIQIFPYLKDDDFFQWNFWKLYKNIDSFSLLVNIFSRLLFNTLYNRYVELYNDYYIKVKKELIPLIVVKIGHKHSFL